jgi:deoxyribodipyrimidine photolyase-related protein
MARTLVLFPNQLFEAIPDGVSNLILVEDDLYFSQFSFHIQKLVLHRASMAAWTNAKNRQGYQVSIEPWQEQPGASLAAAIDQAGPECMFIDPVDDWLSRRIHRILPSATMLPSPDFLTRAPIADKLKARRTPWRMSQFYIDQRRDHGILLEADGEPTGGKWSFDTENRLRLPKSYQPPAIPAFDGGPWVERAVESVRRDFPDAVGSIDRFVWPVTRRDALACLDDFLENRLHNFGPYEDAISSDHAIINHSQLTIPLNLGLLSPVEIIERTLAHAQTNDIPLASLEGFIRQVIGWREFMKLTYESHGRRQRTSNFFAHRRSLPKGFWDGTTGIPPIDHTIRRVLNTGYCHHIERLMILGNFMLLCEVEPDEVYQWFMSLFVDAYDWVMVPNVYGMSQFADGGLITTKPYLSGSAYVRKMSDYAPGPWCDIWDGLYWRFIAKHRSLFESNPRLSMMPKQWDRFPSEKKRSLLETAEHYLNA